MENISPIAETIPVPLEIRPYLLDHRFGGRAVLPAVEAMQILARNAGSRIQDRTAPEIFEASFDKFLALPDKGGRIELLVDLDPQTDGRTRARLKTRMPAGKSAMTRVKTHASLLLSPRSGKAPDPRPAALSDLMAGNGFFVDPQRLYQELVPFGPSYRNICRPLSLEPEGAVARIRAPHRPADEAPLGSPFVLDAAFHAACVWGQRYQNVVAFPVALEKRTIWKPTRSGEEYTAVARPVAADEKQLVFDFWIIAQDRQICETIFGVTMRDVSGGRWKPPGWIKSLKVEGRR